MKASELAEITKKAIAKRSERPAKLLAEVLPRMKEAAQHGESYINYAFVPSDSVEVVEVVLAKLEELGYHITRDQGAKKNLTKISWEKIVGHQCNFDMCWVGRCKQPADLSGYCEKHRGQKCSCGRQATHDCDATVGPLVCGRLLCGSCRCHH